MGGAGEEGPGDALDERIIDRSGDIDQRPPEERGNTASLILFPRTNLESAPKPASKWTAQGSAVVPAPFARERSQSPAPELVETALKQQKALNSRHEKASAQLEAIARKIEVQEKRCKAPKLEDDLQKLRFERQKILIANGPALADRLREEKSRLADLEHFKAANRLKRDAHYPASTVLSVGVLAILIVVEAALNGILFAEGSDMGLLGGWLEATVLALTNLGFAFLLGRLIFPNLHRPNVLIRFMALIASLAGIALVIAINLFGAHYRDFKVAEANAEVAAPRPVAKAEPAPLPGKPPLKVQKLPEPAPVSVQPRGKTEREAIAKVFAAPFDLQSFTSFFLFVIGLCGAAIAAADGYRLDDPFPGYGRRHRRYAEARSETAAALNKIMALSNTTVGGSFQAITRKIEDFAQEVAALQALHHAYAGEHKAQTAALDAAAAAAQEELERQDRLTNKVPSRQQIAEAIWAPALPEFNEKHVKFFETQERKLKSLQKSAQKEHQDLLGLFEAASSDFQKLLAEASHTSFRAALVEGSTRPAEAP